MKRILKYLFISVISLTVSVTAFLSLIYFSRPDCKFCHSKENVMLTWVTYTTETCCQEYLDLPLPPFGLLGLRGRPYIADHPDWGPSGFDHNGKLTKSGANPFKTQGFREWWCLKCSKPAAQAVENHATY